MILAPSLSCFESNCKTEKEQIRDSVSWPLSVVNCFQTLSALRAETDADSVVNIPTASSRDVLVFVGCIAEWHVQNDTLFSAVLLRETSVGEWHVSRGASVMAFDKHFCAAALAQKCAFFGELLRSADFLGADWLVHLLVTHVACEIESNVHDEVRIAELCEALLG